MKIISNKSDTLKGIINLPGDKSISHRALMLLPFCKEGVMKVDNFLFSEDCLRTLRAMKMLGAEIEIRNNTLYIKGKGKAFIKSPYASIYLGNSGTSMRLLSGLLTSQKGSFVLYGDTSLNNRPMQRIIKPLSNMGADISSIGKLGNAPLIMKGKPLRGIDFTMKQSSAQVKSAILFASLFAEGETKINEPFKSRDHTERMLEHLGVNLTTSENLISMDCNQILYPSDINIPSDISSAAFLITAVLITKASDVILKNVGYNKTRIGFIEVIQKMGANIDIIDLRKVNNEEVADIRIKSSSLKAITLEGAIIPRLIDEIPAIAILAAFAQGKTIIKDAAELKVKESNRIKSISYNLALLGIEFEATDDGLIIFGQTIKNTKNLYFNSFEDHRIAMAFSLFGLVFDNVHVNNCDSIQTSFPNFFNTFNSIGATINYI